MSADYAPAANWPALHATDRGSPGWFLLAALVFGTAFFTAELDWRISTYEAYALEADEAEALIAAGSSGRKIAFVAIGLAGAVLLFGAPRRAARPHVVPLMALAGYLLVCMASVVWSDDPSLSAKRVAILLLCWLGVYGVTARFSGRELMRLALLVSATVMVIGVLVELRLGTFRPWAADYRFAGTVHPNTAGATSAVLAITAFFLARDGRRLRLGYVLLFLLGMGLLVLTKSRTGLAGCLLGLSVAWVLGRSTWTRTMTGIAAPFGLVVLLLLALFSGVELTDRLDSAARLGRAELDSGLGALNGRWPLWLDLLNYGSDRWLLGYGYHGFWTPERVYEISVEQGWTLATAHSVPLDIWLSVGLVGLMLFAVGISWSLAAALRRCARGDAVDGWVAALALFAVVSGIFESGFSQPASLDAFIAACGLIYAVRRRADSRDDARHDHAVRDHAPRDPALRGGAT